ncbi:hypothetical protein V3G39_05145 [Dermatophilaceae bacterium Sec6.4]|nr:hypothetical protein [Actinomycetota bacterium]
MGWWQQRIVDAGKEPLAVCLIAFILTFLLTRLVTRLIRSGRGPFRNNVSASGVHVHHAVPGLVLLLLGSLTSLAAFEPTSMNIAGFAIGAGASLVLDEFALILHLKDVYWSHQGRASVQAVALAGMVISLVLLGFTPTSLEELNDAQAPVRYSAIVILLATFVCCLVCAAKGKYRLVVLAVIFPPAAYVGAARLARPGSPWYRRYEPGSAKQIRASTRVSPLNNQWARPISWFADLVAGAPTRDEAPAP